MGWPLIAANLGLNLLGANEQNKKYQEYRGDVDQQIAMGEGGLQRLQTIGNNAQQLGQQLTNQSAGYYNQQDAQGRFNQAYGGIGAGYGQLAPSYAAGAQNLGNQYAGRTATGMGMLQGYGQQARRDINQQYDASGRNQLADLQSRGLGSSTVRSSIAQGNERQRGDALNRLGESVQGMRTGLYSQLSGEQLGHANQAQQFGSNLQLAGLQGQQGVADAQLGYGDAAMQNQLNNAFQFGQYGQGMQADAANRLVGFYGQDINRIPPGQYQPYQL